jgi:ribosome-associated translation inhibitor RaiA
MSWAFRDVWESLYSPINLLFIDELIDKLDRQVAKYKAQRFGFAHEAIKHQDAVEALGSD